MGPRSPGHLIQVAKGQGCHCPAPTKEQELGLSLQTFLPSPPPSECRVPHPFLRSFVVSWDIENGIGSVCGPEQFRGAQQSLGKQSVVLLDPLPSDSEAGPVGHSVLSSFWAVSGAPLRVVSKRFVCRPELPVLAVAAAPALLDLAPPPWWHNTFPLSFYKLLDSASLSLLFGILKSLICS